MNKLFQNKTYICLFFILIFLTSTVVIAGPNDTVTVAIEYDVGTVDTMQVKTGNDLLTVNMHEALMRADPVTAEILPVFAETVQVMPNGKDVAARIKKGHLFHNGDQVTAKDVKWTFEQAVAPENAHLFAGLIEEIEEIEVVDNHNLVFHFYEKFAPWKLPLQIGICSKKYYETVGRDAFSTQPIGSGPLRFVSRDRGKNIIMEAYDGSAHKVNFKTLKLLVVKDPIAQVEMLESGKVDLIYNILPQHAKRLEKKKNIRIKKSSKTPSFFSMFISPMSYPIMKDSNFVRAINHAIDRPALIEKVFLGEGFPIYMYADRTELGYDPNIKYSYSPDKARNLVKASAYKQDDILILTYNTGVPNAVIIATVIQKYLKDVGVEVKLQELDYDTFATYIRNKDRRAGHMAMYAWHGSGDPQIRLMLSIMRDGIYSTYSDRPSQDILDKLILAQSRETDETKRLAILKKIHTIINNEPSSIQLFGLKQIYAMSDRIDYTWANAQGYPLDLHRIKMVE